MGQKRIAVELYAHAIGYYLGNVLNQINPKWGKGWIKSGKQIHVNKDDDRTWQFYVLWESASLIRNSRVVRTVLPYKWWKLL